MPDKQVDNTKIPPLAKSDASLLSTKSGLKPNEKFRKARKAASLSQDKLAKQLKVDSKTVMRWEKGESKPRFDVRKELCELLEKEWEELGFSEIDGQDDEVQNNGQIPEEQSEKQDAEVQRSNWISEEQQFGPAPQKIPLTHRPISRRAVIGIGGGALVAVIGAGVILWPRPTPLQSQTLYYASSTRELAWSPDGAHLASAHHDRTIQIWSTGTWERDPYKGHNGKSGYAHSVAWHPTGKYLASVSGGDVSTVRVWSFPEKKDQFVQQRKEPLITVAWSHHGKYLAFAGQGSTVEVWDPLMNQQVASFNLPAITSIHSVCWSLNDQVVGVATNEKAIFLCDIAQNTILRGLLDAHSGVVNAIAWSPVSPLLFASASFDGTVKIWSVNSDKNAYSSYTGHLGKVLDIVWSQDGKSITSVGTDGAVRQWDAESDGHREIHSFQVAKKDLYTLDRLADGRLLAIGGKEYGIQILSTSS
jgi:WD40 repeat protein/DNA-binding XRE family transcriptional regulator